MLEKGCASYVMAVDKRCYASVDATDDGKIAINAPQLKAKTEFKVGGTPPLKKETLFAEKAVEACLQYLAERGIAAKAMHITTKSDAAFASGAGKSGLGASAAITVATVAATLQAHGFDADKQLVHNISQYAHSSAQGKVGSGFDVACSVYGSVVYSRYSPELVEKADADNLGKLLEKKWDCKIEPLALPPSLLPAFANILAESASTSAMVRQVMAWKEDRLGDYERIIKYLDNANRQAIDALKQGELEAFKRFFELGRVLTAKLGKESEAAIETPELRELVEQSEENGAFCAKLPGAGGGDAIAALCTGEKDRKQLQEFWTGYRKKKLLVIGLTSGNEGVRLGQSNLKT